MISFLLLACQTTQKTDTGNQTQKIQDPWVLQRTDQRTGDPDKGYEYLLYGGYIGSGVPRCLLSVFWNIYNKCSGARRESANIPLPFNLFETPTV